MPKQIDRTASVLVKEYGAEQATLMAAKRADALLNLGDLVLRAVQELLRLNRKPGSVTTERPGLASVAGKPRH
jgi:hypothetical protein